MNIKKIKKGSPKLTISTLNGDTTTDRSRNGIVYTLYSDKFNSLQVGFAANNCDLETNFLNKELIILDKKKGTKEELILLINTLKELGISFSDNLSFKYSDSLMRHLSILGWPIGRSLYKQRKIRKELQCA